MRDVIVIGAGITGITCARALKEAGRDVLVLDKGRGIGGRVATRRVEDGGRSFSFDHGAQYLDEDDSRFFRGLPQASDQLAPWALSSGAIRDVGQPGMSALPRALAKGLDIRQRNQVSQVEKTANCWRVHVGDRAHDARALVLTPPAPQVAALLPADHPFQSALEAVKFDPCLTLMAAFEPGHASGASDLRSEHSQLAWIANDSTKPKRSGDADCWVAQASAGWSRIHFERDRDEMAPRMLELLHEEVPELSDRDALYARVHGWRYGLVAAALCRPFLSEGALYAGGDWCLGARIGDARRSGEAIAREILRQ